MRLPAYLLVAAMTCQFGVALANTVVLQKTIDATTVRSGSSADGAVPAFTLANGDSLVFQVSFLPGQRLVLGDPDLLYLDGFYAASDAANVETHSDTTISFAGLLGSVANPTYGLGSDAGGGFSTSLFLFNAAASLSFTGVTFRADNIQYSAGTPSRTYLAAFLGVIASTVVVTTVPEPSEWAMLGCGLLAVACAVRRGAVARRPCIP